jgi:hypothetical protein
MCRRLVIRLKSLSVAALVLVGVILIVNMLMGVLLTIVLVGMLVLIICMATHLVSPPGHRFDNLTSLKTDIYLFSSLFWKKNIKKQHRFERYL